MAERSKAATECEPHNRPADYAYDDGRAMAGWFRVTCRRCKRFVGYLPIETYRSNLAKTGETKRLSD